MQCGSLSAGLETDRLHLALALRSGLHTQLPVSWSPSEHMLAALAWSQGCGEQSPSPSRLRD